MQVQIRSQMRSQASHFTEVSALSNSLPMNSSSLSDSSLDGVGRSDLQELILGTDQGNNDTDRDDTYT
jgi:hypothetical protein